MGKNIIIKKGASFEENALYKKVESAFTWGPGGKTSPGASSGTINSKMSTIGLPLTKAETNITIIGTKEYRISGVMLSDVPAGSPFVWNTYTDDTYVFIPKGKYYDIELINKIGAVADTSEGNESLIILVSDY